MNRHEREELRVETAENPAGREFVDVATGEEMVKIADVHSPTEAAVTKHPKKGRTVVRVHRGDRLYIEGQIDGSWSVERSYLLSLDQLRGLGRCIDHLLAWLDNQERTYNVITTEEE